MAVGRLDATVRVPNANLAVHRNSVRNRTNRFAKLAILSRRNYYLSYFLGIVAGDALEIINYINAFGPDGNSSLTALAASPAAISSDPLALLAFDQAGDMVGWRRSGA